jgi:hypothetical protein
MKTTKPRPLFVVPKIPHDETPPQIDLRGIVSAGDEIDHARRIRDNLYREHGIKSAAWLVGNKKSAFLSSGLLRVQIPPGEEVPLWFKLAITAFRERSKAWGVIEQSSDDGSLSYVVMWKRWRRLR